MLNENWYALRVRSRSEALACLVLKAKGYTVFSPSCLLPKRRNQKGLERRERPLFPGYLFCRLTLGVSDKMVATPGVIGVVGFGGRPAAIPDSEIESVQRIISVPVNLQPWRYWPAGTFVRIQTGPLTGIEGQLMSDKGARHLVISVTMLQRSIAATLSEETMLEILRAPQYL
jgi:transcription antitermination factor NusG